MAQLLDSRNLVIRGDNDSDPANFLWQSFDFPDNTLLTGMRLGKNLATGQEWYLKSWKSTIDHSPGNFRFELDVSGCPKLVIWNGSARYVNRAWNPSVLLQPKYCDVYPHCGEFGSCNNDSLCICLDGFQPKNIEAWSSLNFSEGCARKIPLNCNNKDDFKRQSNMKLPYTGSSSYNMSMKLEECKIKCPENCSCTAYASTTITKGVSGCLLWFSGLIDIKKQDQSGDVFYVRVGSDSVA
ncbi:G-type lectin S-receptor-like serine/threonine-protein kinase SD1-1 [Apium graveolens]|uniref:G-type lectin S-receptor-like serine/threonine-protein kinase SD1-1 n=1 Tax=Apium graveolens TaxID=4045 RepID=UPI003D79B5D4